MKFSQRPPKISDADQKKRERLFRASEDIRHPKNNRSGPNTVIDSAWTDLK